MAACQKRDQGKEMWLFGCFLLTDCNKDAILIDNTRGSLIMLPLRIKQKRAFWPTLVFVVTNLVCLFIALLLLLLDIDPHSVFGKRCFSDFLETMAYAVSGDPYRGIPPLCSNYPPLPILLVYPFSFFCRGTVEAYLRGDIALEYAYKNVDFLCAYLLYYVLSLCFLGFAAYKLAEKYSDQKWNLTVALLFCGPVLYCFGRGNVLFPAIAFTFLFFTYYDNKSRALREIAVLFLALAAAFKLYPAVFALLYIKEKRTLDFFKTVIYTAFLVFVPLCFFQGSYGTTVKLFIKGVVGFNNATDRYLHYSNVSFDFLLTAIALACEKLFHKNIYFGLDIVSSVIHGGLLLVTIVLSFLLRGKKEQWGRYITLLSCLCLFFTKVSYGYNLLYFFVPFLCFRQERMTYTRAHRIVSGCAYFLLFFPAFFLFKFFFLQMVAAIYLLFDAAIGLIRHERKKKRFDKSGMNGCRNEKSCKKDISFEPNNTLKNQTDEECL